LSTLARGYAICRVAGTGDVVREAEQVTPGELLHVRVHRGAIACRVERVGDV